MLYILIDLYALVLKLVLKRELILVIYVKRFCTFVCDFPPSISIYNFQAAILYTRAHRRLRVLNVRNLLSALNFSFMYQHIFIKYTQIHP